MRVWKMAGLFAALAGISLLLAACGGDSSSDGSQTGIRTDRGLAVAAVGANFDPRLQSSGNGAADRKTSAQTGAEPAPTQGAPADAISQIGGRNGSSLPYYAPAFAEGGNGITVQGYGTASADANSAVAEFYFFAGGGGVEPQSAPDASSGSGGTSSGGVPVPPNVKPGASQTEVAQITEADLKPVIDALTGAGVPRDKIEFVSQGYYDKFSSNATLRATVSDLGALDGAVAAAKNAAAGLAAIQLSSTNVTYTVSDCTALEKAAMKEAVADAKDRGVAFAETLGVGLGNVTGATHYSYSPYGGNACSGTFGGPVPLLAGASPVQGGSRTVQVFANISVTYAIQ